MVRSSFFAKAANVTGKKRSSLWVIVVLLSAWALLTIQIGSAWFGHQDANGAWISAAVRNYQWHGLTYLGGLVDLSPNPNGPPQPYTHHPPLVVWLEALPVLLAGYHEALIRFVAAACTLLSAAALYVLARRLRGERFALWSMIFYLFTPLMAYFGRMPDHEAPALLLVLLFAAVLVDWLRQPTRRGWWTLAALVVLVCWTAWGGLIVVAALGGAALFDRRRRGAILLLGLAAGAALVAFFGYELLFVPNAISDLIDVFIWRTSSSSLEPGAVAFTAADYLLRLFIRLVTLYTPTLLLLVLVGAGVMLPRRGLLRRMTAALLVGACAYLLLFRNASYIHDYYLLYTAPAFALLAAAVIDRAGSSRRSRWLRPLVAALTLVTLPTALYYLGEFHGSNDSALGLEFAQVVRAQTTPDDLILSNLPSSGPALEFYAERTITWALPPAAALAAAGRASQTVYYLHCDNYSTLPAATPERPAVAINPQCRLTRLR